MSGKHVGVQTILREHFPTTAIYVHCFVHRLNLVVCDMSKIVPYLSKFYSIISNIHKYLHSSSVTSESFKNIQQQLILGEINYLSPCYQTGS